MQSTQLAASPQDQPQYATDPLAIDESVQQQEPLNQSNCAETETHTSGQSPQLSEVAPPQSNAQNEPAPAAITFADDPPKATPIPTDGAVGSPTKEDVKSTNFSIVDPSNRTDPATLNNEAVTEDLSSQKTATSSSHSTAGEKVVEPKEIGSSSCNRTESTVPSADTSTVTHSNTAAAEESEADGAKSAEPNNDVPTSSSSSSGSTSGSGSSANVSNGNSNSNSFIGVKSAVTSDNRIKINGISDLSILDVTEGNDDEIEVKVEGGSLMHKVIKFSLLNGMQDSTKRLENSRLIMSGVSSTNGEATLATTSSLTRGSLGGGPLRQDDKAKEEGFKGGTLENKTTPPACSSVRPDSLEPSSSFSNSSNSSDSSSNLKSSENTELRPNRTEESSNRLRNSTDSKISGSGNESVHEESVSDTYSRSASLDFREWPKSSTTSVPTVAASTPCTSAPTTASSIDLSKTNKETDLPTSAPSPPPKRSKAMYYAELPDFSKPVLTAPNNLLMTPTPTSTVPGRDCSFSSTKSLSQLQMKTPDFSRIMPASSVPHSSSSSIPVVSTSAVAISTTTSRSHELQIANPDFSRSFSSKSHHSAPPPVTPTTRADATYLNQATFAEISKKRNYISDLQLKNPPRQEVITHPHSSVVKGPINQSPGPSLSNYRIDKPQSGAKPYPPSLYRQEMQLEEPKAHVIHKSPSASLPEAAGKTWNPAHELNSKPYPQSNDKHRYTQQYPTSGQKGPPPLTSEPPSHIYPEYGHPYPPPTGKGKESIPASQSSAAHPGGIIVNNVKPYYPEPHQSLPKSKEPDFRLEHKEKQLRQEGTIITLKSNESRPPVNHPQSTLMHPQSSQSYHPPPRSRSPSVDQREAQMMASSQEILYRDFKLKQSYEMPPQSAVRASAMGRPLEESRCPRPTESTARERSPYDPYYRGSHSAVQTPPSKYYTLPDHHKQPISPASSAASSPTPMVNSQNRSPAPIPPQKLQQMGGMHPPSGWPSQSRVIASPHGGSANSSPLSVPSSVSPNHFMHQKNSPSPVNSYGMQPGPSHGYKSPSPSSSSSSPYGGSASAGTAGNSITKYTQYYPGSSGERVVSIEIDKESYKPGFKSLDYNMEQKFAEVYQAHQMKEKHATSAKPVDPYKGHPYPGSSTEYPRHPADPGGQHPSYKPAEHKPQEPYYEEYSRVRAASMSAPSAPSTTARYTHSQENLNHYQQYQYPPRNNPDVDIRKSDPQLYKPTNRDPSPAQRYASSESLYNSSKQSVYPPNQASSTKPPSHHPGYPPPSGNESLNSSTQYSIPSSKSSYSSSPYDRSSEKQQPSVISNNYSQERAGPRTSYPEQRSHPPMENYPAGHHYPPEPQMKAASSQPYPHQHTVHPTSPSTSRDPAGWHYQQTHQPPAPQPGPSGHGSERMPMSRDDRHNPVIQPPITKNIPVKVIATANAAPTVASSTTVAPATSTTKRESPLDLSVKTVKTKADSTASDDYAHSNRNREVVPRVNFSPNFKKHIPERHPVDNRPLAPTQAQSYLPFPSREPISPHQHALQQPASSSKSSPAPSSQLEHQPIANLAIPPGYDKRTDAYMSANYRAVGGSGEGSVSRLPQESIPYPATSTRPGPTEYREHSVPYGIPPGAYPHRMPTTGIPAPQHPYQQPGSSSKPDPYYPNNNKTTSSASSRSVYYPPHEVGRTSSKHPGAPQKPTMNDPRIEDRKFVESMLKKQTSPSAEVIADLQAGKFSTRIPSALAPAKKRVAESVPKTSPTKVSRVEESNLHRPYDNNNYRHPPFPVPAAPRDYYPVPIKLEPASPQPAGVYYSDKRSEGPSITRGVLTTAPSNVSPAAPTHSVLQPNVQQNIRQVDPHPSVITSYQSSKPPPPQEVHRPRGDESSQQRDYRPSYGQSENRQFYPKQPEPFRQGHGDPKYYGSSVDKSSCTPDQNNYQQSPSTIVMHSHIQYSGQPPVPYKQAEPQPQPTARPESYCSPPNHVVRSPSIVENNHSKSQENIPHTLAEPLKCTPPLLHSSQESLSQASSAPSPQQHRGVDQSVISKLRTSLEQKERNNQLRKQPSSEMSEEDAKPVDVSSFPPSHFRSKGAMKAYTPIPAFDMTPSTPQPTTTQSNDSPSVRQPSPVKSEPVDIPEEPIEPPPDIEGTAALDILDWGSACNEFVEQLQTGKKRGRRKRSTIVKRENESSTGHDGFHTDLPGMASSTLADVPQEVLISAAQEMTGDFSSSSDEDKPLHLLKQQQPNSTEELKEEDPLQGIRNSTMEKLSEKIARNIRDKQRLELEQRHEAKLGRSSSSDSESDTRRVVQRSKLRARKLRHRSSVPLKLSDVNTDGEDEEDEEEGARDLRKRKKVEQTSSESEGTNVKRMSRCQSQIKQDNGSDLSSDEEDPKKRSNNIKDRAPESKSKLVGQGAPSDSDGNDVKPKESVNGKKNREAEAQFSGNESEKSDKDRKKGVKKLVKTRSKTKVVEESSESSKSSVEELETMTRSKSKLELEKRRSNSKVLRNDKIIENFVKERKKPESVTPQKGRKGAVNAKLEATKKRILDSDSDCKSVGNKKRTRKVSKLQTTSTSSSSEESDAETVSERLRSRKQQKCSETSAPSSSSKKGNNLESRTPAKQSASVEKKTSTKSEPQKKRGRQAKKTSKDCATENTSENFYPGWEKELYEFKRSLKVPPQLIMIGGRQYVHRISASLPDLDSHHSDESETFSEIVRKINQKDASTGKKVKTKAASKHASKNVLLSNKELQEEKKKIDDNKKFSSIIEILHERILRHVKLAKAKKSKTTNEKESSKPKPEFELLPTPGAESEALFNRKKKSLFDTAIMKSRTRTEQKVMQSKEIIREVFGGEDERPQSAPPLGCMPQLKNVTYDEMYNEMLSKSNNVATFLAQKKAQEEKARSQSLGLPGSSTKVKIEDLDDETQDSVLKELGRVTGEECDTPSVAGSERDLATPVSFKSAGKKKSHKSRRKGSSGFDYIRKKKKPQPTNENSTLIVPKKKVTSVFENLVSKDETHISKEIRSWVLNKGVGESVMHKAARLGYTDVIVYCLERLEMDPDLKDNAGYTPLHEACAKGHLDICNYLLQYGASHSETAPSGVRPLHEAVENSFIEVVRLLLAFGADPMLATYAGQTPIQLAENNEMALFLENHLYDIQSMSPLKTAWRMDGPWKTHDPEESGCHIFADIPGFSDDENLQNSSTTTERSTLSSSTGPDGVDSQPQPVRLPPPPPPPLPPAPQVTPKKCDSNSNIMNFEVKLEPDSIEQKYKDCAVVLNDIHDLNNEQIMPAGSNYVNGQMQKMKFERNCPNNNCDQNSNGVARFDESDDEDDFLFEYEEADRPLPPLYLLKDESGGDKWVLMTDLCNFLKLKSKEAVIKQICSTTTPITTANNTNGTSNGNGSREIIRELKIEEFLTRASCLQLLCAGEKLNINSNKVILVKYNENVRNLLQVQTMVTKI
ncbi:protein piccolo [Malaya genurostris]|uniref:protein piccolo n=1 Tax=Malaya genurostris TaxID=325434 RepID=UPI0026F3ADD8|nr:protein piccolo [Malaya genurostris]